MGDHSIRSGRIPPTTGDHANWNSMQISVAVGSVACSVGLLLDVFVFPDQVFISHVLSLTTVVSRLSTAALFMFGGILAVLGILCRPRNWKPLTSVITEGFGWVSLSLGWISAVLSTLTHYQDGSLFSVIMYVCLAGGSVWEAAILVRVALRSLSHVARMRESERKLRALQEGAQ